MIPCKPAIHPDPSCFEAGAAGRSAITAHEFGTVAKYDATPRKHREITLLYLEVLPE
jgi:hypothetical protein